LLKLLETQRNVLSCMVVDEPLLLRVVQRGLLLEHYLKIKLKHFDMMGNGGYCLPRTCSAFVRSVQSRRLQWVRRVARKI
jgi:hypothetical protein